ncbi:hypothetical protein ABW19_dt0206033 [Dactylella cylindrospora]|nr:hypothetical protein ABW19_dt0206033 [Dactylella cylindrospora]
MSSSSYSQAIDLTEESGESSRPAVEISPIDELDELENLPFYPEIAETLYQEYHTEDARRDANDCLQSPFSATASPTTLRSLSSTPTAVASAPPTPRQEVAVTPVAYPEPQPANNEGRSQRENRSPERKPQNHDYTTQPAQPPDQQKNQSPPNPPAMVEPYPPAPQGSLQTFWDNFGVEVTAVFMILLMFTLFLVQRHFYNEALRNLEKRKMDL